MRRERERERERERGTALASEVSEKTTSKWVTEKTDVCQDDEIEREDDQGKCVDE